MAEYNDWDDDWEEDEDGDLIIQGAEVKNCGEDFGKDEDEDSSYTIAVMDYSSGTIRFFNFDSEPKYPEHWLETHDPDWKDSQCYWMGVRGNIDLSYRYASTVKELSK